MRWAESFSIARLGNANTSINDLDFRRLRKVFTELGVRKLNELLAAIGNGELMAYVAAQKLLAADDPDYAAVEVQGGGPLPFVAEMG